MVGSQLASGEKNQLYTSENNKCALNDFFINKDENGNIISYECDPNILLVCN